MSKYDIGTLKTAQKAGAADHAAKTAAKTSAEPVKYGNLTIQMPIHLRHHWRIESVRAGVSMSEVARQAFEAAFGLPE